MTSVDEEQRIRRAAALVGVMAMVRVFPSCSCVEGGRRFLVFDEGIAGRDRRKRERRGRFRNCIVLMRRLI